MHRRSALGCESFSPNKYSVCFSSVELRLHIHWRLVYSVGTTTVFANGTASPNCNRGVLFASRRGHRPAIATD